MIAFWNYFVYFAIVAVLLWITGAWAAWKDRQGLAYSATLAGLAVFFGYILMMWISLDRPPMRTMGETRLWYSFFLPLAGIIVYSRWNYKWLLSFSTILSMVFIGVNLLKPEIHSKTLMPALQSPWFAPHVIIYMFAYALLGGCLCDGGLSVVFQEKQNRNPERIGHYRQPCLYWLGLSFAGHAYGSVVGQGCMGKLLVVGSQGNMGCSYMAGLSYLCSLSPAQEVQLRGCHVDTCC